MGAGKGRVMPENTETVENATQGAPAEPERTFTQAEMDAIIGDRLKRERAKYADYDEAKAALDELTQLKEANKSELEKAVEERDRLKAELEKRDAERAHAEKVAELMGVPRYVQFTMSTVEYSSQSFMVK